MAPPGLDQMKGKKMRKRTALMATFAAAALVLTGCAGGNGDSNGGGGGGGTDVELEGSPTFDSMRDAGKVVIGVKEDQPGLGYLDPITEERSGFDIEIAKWIAEELGFSEGDIEYKAIPSANRETALVNGDVDYYVGTYSITDNRKEQIDFAGPYFVTGQGILVAADDDSINSENDLVGKTVCSATGSTPIQNIRDNYPDTDTVEFDTYTQCVDALINGQVDAVTTDQAILLGYASGDPDNLKVVGEPFTVENYGVGLPKGDDALRAFINDMFTEQGDRWQEIYDGTLGQSGTVVEQPEVDAY